MIFIAKMSMVGSFQKGIAYGDASCGKYQD